MGVGVAVACYSVSIHILRTYPTYGSQGATIREVRMYYGYISLGCGKCDATPFHCFPKKHNYAYRFLLICYTIASKLQR